MHQASLHFPQLGYFLAFAIGIGWPVLLDEGLGRVGRRVGKDAFGGIKYVFLLKTQVNFFLGRANVFWV